MVSAATSGAKGGSVGGATGESVSIKGDGVGAGVGSAVTGQGLQSEHVPHPRQIWSRPKSDRETLIQVVSWVRRSGVRRLDIKRSFRHLSFFHGNGVASSKTVRDTYVPGAKGFGEVCTVDCSWLLTVAVHVVDAAVQASRVAHDRLPAVVVAGQGLRLSVRQVVAHGPPVGADVVLVTNDGRCLIAGSVGAVKLFVAVLFFILGNRRAGRFRHRRHRHLGVVKPRGEPIRREAKTSDTKRSRQFPQVQSCVWF